MKKNLIKSSVMLYVINFVGAFSTLSFSSELCHESEFQKAQNTIINYLKNSPLSQASEFLETEGLHHGGKLTQRITDMTISLSKKIEQNPAKDPLLASFSLLVLTEFVCGQGMHNGTCSNGYVAPFINMYGNDYIDGDFQLSLNRNSGLGICGVEVHKSPELRLGRYRLSDDTLLLFTYEYDQNYIQLLKVYEGDRATINGITIDEQDFISIWDSPNFERNSEVFLN